tara:strand:+ start:1374 stop:1775 length:402 start_codon:yes stop_codon:yes gene_type:complete
MENGKVEKIWDNSENGNPNFSIDLADGKRLYARENVSAKIGEMISYTAINTKTSKNGNQYTNVTDIKVVNESNNTTQPKAVPLNGNGIDRPDQARRDIFVTGVVGRSMGSGHFSVDDIENLTANAVIAWNKLK